MKSSTSKSLLQTIENFKAKALIENELKTVKGGKFIPTGGYCTPYNNFVTGFYDSNGNGMQDANEATVTIVTGGPRMQAV